MNFLRTIRSAFPAFIALAVVIALAIGISGCGNSDEDVQQAVDAALQKEKEREREKKLAAEQKRLKRELKKLKRKTQSGSSSSGGGSTASSSCGGGVSVNSVTTCPFARNVADAVGSAGTGVVYAYSPALGRDVRMSCSGSATITCVGGNNALVTIR